VGEKSSHLRVVRAPAGRRAQQRVREGGQGADVLRGVHGEPAHAVAVQGRGAAGGGRRERLAGEEQLLPLQGVPAHVGKEGWGGMGVGVRWRVVGTGTGTGTGSGVGKGRKANEGTCKQRHRACV